MSPRVANGAVLAHALYIMGCHETYGNCSNAAERILKREEIPIVVFGENMLKPANWKLEIEPKGASDVVMKYLEG